MARYTVNYAVETHYEAVVEAGSIKEAKDKVKEVVGIDIQIYSVWQIKEVK